MNITFETANELYALGFSYRHYQKHCQKGMVYYYNGSEWVIGGNVDEPLTDTQREIIDNGTWLPSEANLIEWLQDNDFVFVVVNTDGFFKVECKDTVTNTQYNSKMPTLEFAMAAIIKKILKKHEREFDTKEPIYGVIVE
ncbi:MAG: hypothetical protein PUB37_04950 [Firmicutes bacterium]|nr:hypothetical protein [Bacillota bacterium]